MNPTTISFAGNNLQQITSYPYVITSDIDHESDPTKQDKAYPLSHANNASIPFVEYPSKPIKLTGHIIASTKALYEAELDVFKSYFNTTSGQLILGYNNSQRVYYATADKVIVKRPLGTTKGDFEIDMTATPGWGFDNFVTNLYTTSGTSQSLSQTLTFSGSAPWQAPIITVTMQTISGSGSGETISGTGGSITIGNQYTGQQATVQNTGWGHQTVIVFDSTLNQVTVNGVVTQFAGALPQFQGSPTGTSGTLTYSDTFGTRSYLLSAQYTVRYK